MSGLHLLILAGMTRKCYFEYNASLYIVFFFLNSDRPSFSGINDFDYQSSVHVDGTPASQQVASIKRVPLPDELLEQFSRIFFLYLDFLWLYSINCC